MKVLAANELSGSLNRLGTSVLPSGFHWLAGGEETLSLDGTSVYGDLSERCSLCVAFAVRNKRRLCCILPLTLDWAKEHVSTAFWRKG